MNGEIEVSGTGSFKKYSIFISYRVDSDADFAGKLFDLCEASGYSTYIDKERIRDGHKWAEEFVDGLSNSRVFIPIISKAGQKERFSNLNADSYCDNVLLEYRLALEYLEKQRIELIYPIFVPEVNTGSGKYASSYFAQGAMPQCPRVCVKSVEQSVNFHLERQGFGPSPLLEDRKTVEAVVKEMTDRQGAVDLFVSKTPEEVLPLIGERVDAFMTLLGEELSCKEIQWSDLKPMPNTTPLTSGAFGVVVFAYWRKSKYLTMKVAVKILKINDIGLTPVMYKKAEKDLKNEARVLQVASADMNDNVVRFYGIGKGGTIGDEWTTALGLSAVSCLFDGGDGPVMLGLVMRLEEGGDLRDLLHNPELEYYKTITTLEKLKVSSKIVAGLSLLHHAGIKHGDIKSDNVLLAQPYQAGVEIEPRLADFGLATISKNVAAMSAMSSVRSTDEKRGTFPYMAIEMFRRITMVGKVKKRIEAVEASRTTDVYAVGTLIWEVLTGAVPWKDYNEGERINMLQMGDTLDFELLPADTPSAIRNTLTKCLSNEREDRPRVDDLRMTLECAVNEIESTLFDIVLSYADSSEGNTKALIQQIYLSLVNSGYRVGMDLADTKGITDQTVLVAFLSNSYLANATMLENIQLAVSESRELFICTLEINLLDSIASDHEILALLPFLSNAKEDDFADFALAANENWTNDISQAQRALLQQDPNALRKLRVQLFNAEVPKNGDRAKRVARRIDVVEKIKWNDDADDDNGDLGLPAVAEVIIQVSVLEKNMVDTIERRDSTALRIATNGTALQNDAFKDIHSKLISMVKDGKEKELKIFLPDICGQHVLSAPSSGCFQNSYTPLHYAVLGNNANILKLLWDNGADLNVFKVTNLV